MASSKLKSSTLERVTNIIESTVGVHFSVSWGDILQLCQELVYGSQTSCIYV